MGVFDGGVFTPTESRRLLPPGFTSNVNRLICLRGDHGPLKGENMDERSERRAARSCWLFNGTGLMVCRSSWYGKSCLFFIWADSETITGGDRVGLGPQIMSVCIGNLLRLQTRKAN